MDSFRAKSLKKKACRGFQNYFGSISQNLEIYKEKRWLFDEISVNSTLLCPLGVVYCRMYAKKHFWRKPMDEKKKASLTAEADGIIEGRNAVIEALRAGETIDKIYLQKGETDKTLGHIASKARAAGVVVVEADKRKLDGMSRTHAHQGVIALAAVREYVSVESILQSAADRGENPLLVICDEISDPHNLGAIIRTAECAGAHGVVIPKRRSAGLTAVVAKTSAGAVAHVPVARVPNIPSLLKDLKKQGVWVFGTAADGNTTLYEADLKGPAAIVIGSEGEGMTRLAAENCDFLVSIPMRGKLNSLNASAAAAILLYEAVRQRM